VQRDAKEGIMTTLITGGTGFLGAEVTRLLVEKGNTSIILLDVALRRDDWVNWLRRLNWSRETSGILAKS